MVLEFDRVGAVDKSPDLGDGETAFEPAVLLLFVDGAKHFLTDGDDFGFNEDLGGLLLLIEEDEETLVETDLGGGQTDAFGIYGVFEDF